MLCQPINSSNCFQPKNLLTRQVEKKQGLRLINKNQVFQKYQTYSQNNLFLSTQPKKQIQKHKFTNISPIQAQVMKSLKKNLSSANLKQKIQFNKSIIQKSLNIMKQIKSNLSSSSIKPEKAYPNQNNDKYNNNNTNFLSCSLENSDPKQLPKKIKIAGATNGQQIAPNRKRREQPEYFVLRINDKVHIFLTLRFIDQGAFGKIFLVSHVPTGFLVCLKVYPKASFGEDSFRQLQRQIKIQSFMNHPNIVALYGFAADADNIYLLLQPCLGSNAYQKLNEKPVSEKQVKKYIKEISAAIQYMHKLQILHRDIKAENVVFHQNVAKICDFGWAVHASDFRNTQCGTPVYLAPQIIKCQDYDSKIDVWSIGVLTYELLFGKNPFQVNSLNDLENIIQNEVSFEDHLSLTGKAKQFIKHCLAKLPLERLTISQCLQHQFLAAEPAQIRHHTSNK